MKAIDFAQGLKKKLVNNLAPISKGEINLLVDMLEKEAQKPTVVTHLEDGLIVDIVATCEMSVIVADYDNDGATSTIKVTPSGEGATVEFAAVNVCVESERYIAAWVALANQE